MDPSGHGVDPVAEHYGETVDFDLLDFIGDLAGIVLDVGCGTGSWAPELRVAGAERLIGIEPTGDAEAAAARYDQIITDKVESAELPVVDVVIAANVLEHLHDPWTALHTLRTSCKPGGRLVVSVPNIQFMKAVMTIVRGDFPAEDGGFWDRTHLHWFTLKSLNYALLQAGWQMERHRYVLGTGMRQRLSKVTGERLGMYLGHQLHVEATAI